MKKDCGQGTITKKKLSASISGYLFAIHSLVGEKQFLHEERQMTHVLDPVMKATYRNIFASVGSDVDGTDDHDTVEFLGYRFIIVGNAGWLGTLFLFKPVFNAVKKNARLVLADPIGLGFGQGIDDIGTE